MSNSAVRTELRRRIKESIKTLAVAPVYHDTINNSDDIKDKEWISCSFSAYGNTPECYSDGHFGQESGMCNVFAFVRANTGEDRVLEILEHIAQSFIDDSGAWGKTGVVVEEVNPAEEAFEGDTRKWFVMYIGLSYTYSS